MTVEGAGRAAARRKRRRRTSVFTVLGELFLTGAVLVLLFLGWQNWLNDIIVGIQQHDAAGKLSQEWQRAAVTPTTGPTTGPTTDPTSPTSTPTPTPTTASKPKVEKEPTVNAARFGILMVPRWGADYARPIAQGIGVLDVLDKIGIGHYPGTQMPGQVGNFAIAAHRLAYGGGFRDIYKLHVGDHIFVETKDGWYQYTYRNLQYVQPSEVNVLQPVPEQPNAKATQRMITLTTCNPFFSTAERMVAYGLFDTWYPRAGGPPAEIAKTVKAESK
jgi:sortase A